jgi:hypothetical protein
MSRGPGGACPLGVGIRCGDQAGEAWALLAIRGTRDPRPGTSWETRSGEWTALGRERGEAENRRGDGAHARATGAPCAAGGGLNVLGNAVMRLAFLATAHVALTKPANTQHAPSQHAHAARKTRIAKGAPAGDLLLAPPLVTSPDALGSVFGFWHRPGLQYLM